jgi:Tfp pilus assembly protein PilN
MRINLLPREILEQRRAEKRVGWVAVGGLAVVVVLAAVWLYADFGLNEKQNELASIEQQTQAIQAQADQLAVFEMRASELEERRQIARSALAGRLDTARLLEEVSLVLPTDLWVETMLLDEVAGLSVTGYAVDSTEDTPYVGHKAIAKGLVRLADLDTLSDVWLTNSTKTLFEEQAVIQFSITAKASSANPEVDFQ